MGFYEDMQGIATDLLTEFKQGTLYLAQTTQAPPDPAKPWLAPTTTTRKFLLNGVLTNVNRKFIDNVTIVAADSQATVAVPGVLTEIDGSPALDGATQDIEPYAGDILIVDGNERAIIAVKRIPDAGTTVALALVVRS